MSIKSVDLMLKEMGITPDDLSHKYNYELSFKQKADLEIYHRTHKCNKKRVSVSFGNGTGIGMSVSAHCICCDHYADLSDYESW